MKVTISEYDNLETDINGTILMAGGPAVASNKLEAAGTFPALQDETRFVRVATDTAIHLKHGAGATTSDPYLPAGSVEFFAAREGTTFSFVAG